MYSYAINYLLVNTSFFNKRLSPRSFLNSVKFRALYQSNRVILASKMRDLAYC